MAASGLSLPLGVMPSRVASAGVRVGWTSGVPSAYRRVAPRLRAAMSIPLITFPGKSVSTEGELQRAKHLRLRIALHIADCVIERSTEFFGAIPGSTTGNVQVNAAQRQIRCPVQHIHMMRFWDFRNSFRHADAQLNKRHARHAHVADNTGIR